MKEIWFGAAAGSFGLFGWLVSSDATKSANGQHYSFWFSPLAVGADAALAVGVAAAICGLISVRGWWLRKQARMGSPSLLSSAQGNHVLPERSLRKIRKMSAMRGRTRAEKRRLLAPYYGRQIEVFVTVKDVGEWNGSSSRVTGRTCVRGFTASMNFTGKDAFDRDLSRITRNQRVIVIGEIEQVERDGIYLANCEIVSMS